MAAFAGPSKRRTHLDLIQSEDESDYGSSSEDVTEDEDGVELTPALDAAILRTLSKIRRGEGVYESENVLQDELNEAEDRAGKSGVKQRLMTVAKEKPYLLSHHHRAQLLSAADEHHEGGDTQDTQPLTNVQADRLLRSQTLNAFKGLAEEVDEEAEEGFLERREQLDREEVNENEGYRQFLLEMGGGEEAVRKALGMGDQPVSFVREDDDTLEDAKPLLSEAEKVETEAKRRERKAKKAKIDEDFLINYILDRGWIDRTEKHVPTYREVVGSQPENIGTEEEANEASRAGPSSHPWGVLEEDDFDDKADQFEAEYNFRYEEPGATSISSHPRNITSLVRRPDDTRKLQRQSKAERKAVEKAGQEEETRRLKGKKRREMERELRSLKKELGEEGVDWEGLEKVLEGEWDEEEWDRVVNGMLERKAVEDEGKPAWDDEIGDAAYDGEEEEAEGDFIQLNRGLDHQEGSLNMDADYIGFEEPKKRKDKKAKRREPIADANAALTAAQRAEKIRGAMQDYQDLEHEDMIGDLPTRFKYSYSAPVNFGLTPVEILLATEDELNQIASVRHIATYRNGGMGIAGKGIGKRVKQLKDDLKRRRWGEEGSQKIPERKVGSGSGANSMPMGRKEDGEARRPGKRQGKSERMRRKGDAGASGDGQNVATGRDQAMIPVPPSTEDLDWDRTTKRSVEHARSSEIGGTADGAGKRKRRKKRKGDAGGNLTAVSS